MAGLVVVGISANSLGVLAEGADYLADAAAIGVSLLAVRVSKLPPTPKRPQGYPMATTWAAGVNAGWLLVLSVAILVGAAGRLLTGSGVIYVTNGLYWLDPVVAAIIAAVVGFHAVRLLLEIVQALRSHRRSVSRP